MDANTTVGERYPTKAVVDMVISPTINVFLNRYNSHVIKFSENMIIRHMKGFNFLPISHFLMVAPVIYRTINQITE